jgi:pre-rRNA-processing protein IPI1
LLLLFTASALTHIFPEIRIDAVRFLNLFLDHIPDSVVMNWKEDDNSYSSRILEGYLGILNAGTKFDETDGNVVCMLAALNNSPDYSTV